VNKALVVLLACSFGLTSVDRRAPNRLHFKAAGFSIQALEDRPGPVAHQALMMMLPPSGGFAPNVGVQIHPHAGSMDEYAALSKRQFVTMKLTLIRETKVGKAAVAFEYSGKMRGRRLHWYAKAIAKDNRVYLVTATCTEAQWPRLSARLKACVDSFQLEKSDPPRSADRPSPAKSDAGKQR